MSSTTERYQTALVQARASADGPALFKARLTLFADRLSLSGWSWRGRYRRDVPLAKIAQVHASAPDHLDVLLSSGARLALTLNEAELWRQAILAHRDVTCESARQDPS